MKRFILIYTIGVLTSALLAQELSIEPQVENCIKNIVQCSEFQDRDIKNIWIGEFRESSTKQKRLISNLLRNTFTKSITSLTTIKVVKRIEDADALLEGEFLTREVWLTVNVKVKVESEIIASEDITTKMTEDLKNLCAQKISKKASMGYISIETNRDPAEVLVDYGEWKASSGAGMRLAVSTGKHDISVLKKGWESKTFTVEIKRGRTWSKYVILEPGKGGIKVSSQPSGADIFLDGRSIDEKTPFEKKNLKVGVYDVEIKYPNYKTAKTRVEIEKEGEIKPVHFRLTGLPAALNIRTINVDGAKVYVDGKSKGISKNKLLEIPQVSCGEHLIKITKPGYSTYKKIVEIKPNKPEIMKVALSDKPRIKCPGGYSVDIPSNNSVPLPLVCDKFQVENGFAKHPLGYYVTGGDQNNWRNYDFSSIEIVPTKHLSISFPMRIGAFMSSAVIPYSGEGIVMKDIRNVHWTADAIFTFLPFVAAYSCDKTEEIFYNKYLEETDPKKIDLFYKATDRNKKHKKFFIGLGASLWGFSLAQTLFRGDRIVPSSPEVTTGGLKENLRIIGLFGFSTSYFYESYHIYSNWIVAEKDTLTGEITGYRDKCWLGALFSIFPIYHEYVLIKEALGSDAPPWVFSGEETIIAGNSQTKAWVLLGCEALGLLTEGLNLFNVKNQDISLDYNPGTDNIEIRYVLRF